MKVKSARAATVKKESHKDSELYKELFEILESHIPEQEHIPTQPLTDDREENEKMDKRRR